MNSSFHSALAPDIESFIKMKHSLGYKYHNEEYILHRFDTYWKNENDPSDSVTMESLSGWEGKTTADRREVLPVYTDTHSETVSVIQKQPWETIVYPFG